MTKKITSKENKLLVIYNEVIQLSLEHYVKFLRLIGEKLGI